MTPLAAYIAKQLVARPKHREGIWRDARVVANGRILLEDVHCFEISDCMDLIEDMVLRRTPIEQLFETYGFLPAPKTWLEWRTHKHGFFGRRALCLTQHPEPMLVDGVMRETVAMNMCEAQNAMCLGYFIPSTGEYCPNPDSTKGWKIEETADDIAYGWSLLALHALLLINSPKIIGRRQHMPHAGLERRLTRGLGAGKFPLHAWTEILLEVNKPIEIDDGEPHEAHLTGKRALHFCRKHIRIQNRQLVYVSAHWRGDPALGIKRSRYTVQPGMQ